MREGRLKTHHIRLTFHCSSFFSQYSVSLSAWALGWNCRTRGRFCCMCSSATQWKSTFFPYFILSVIFFFPCPLPLSFSLLISKFENPCTGIFFSISSLLPLSPQVCVFCGLIPLSHFPVYSSLSNPIYLSIFIFHRTPVTLLSLHPRSPCARCWIATFSLLQLSPHTLWFLFSICTHPKCIKQYITAWIYPPEPFLSKWLLSDCQFSV